MQLSHAPLPTQKDVACPLKMSTSRWNLLVNPPRRIFLYLLGGRAEVTGTRFTGPRNTCDSTHYSQIVRARSRVKCHFCRRRRRSSTPGLQYSDGKKIT